MRAQVLLRCCLLAVLGAVSAAGWSQPAEVAAAARANDLAKVRTLLTAGADPDQVDDDCLYPLSYAVDHGNLDMARALLDAGADVNAVYGPELGPSRSSTTLVVRAAGLGKTAMVDLLLSRGASRYELDAHYQSALEWAVDGGELEEARELIATGRARVPGSFDWVMRSEYGSDAIRTFIRESNPSMAGRSILGDLVSMLDAGPQSFWSLPAGVSFPLSTSSLPDQRQPGRYAPGKAFDNDLSTSWVEGRSDDGIGEMIAFEVPANATSVSIVPGYGEEQYYALNNRVKTARLMICRFRAKPSQTDLELSATLLAQMPLPFADALRPQPFSLKVPTGPDYIEGLDVLFAVLEIQAVYPGSRWRDTCIAEITVR